METGLDSYVNTCVVEDATAIRVLTSECTQCDETKSANARIVMDDFQMSTPLGQGTSQTRETVQDIAFPKPKEKFGRWLEPAIDTGPV